MKIGEVIYYCLDAIKAFSDDSYVNEDHVLFLLGKYRGALLQQYHNVKKPITESNFQTVCLDLKQSDTIPYTRGSRLVSIQCVPHLIPVSKATVLMFNGMENEIIEFVPYQRLKSVGWNKFKSNFIYAAIGPDNRVHLSFINPQAAHLKNIKVKGIFEDFIEASNLDCTNQDLDLLKRDFPLEVALIPDLIARVVKDVLGMAWRPADKTNDGDDSLSDIAAFVRRTMKKDFNNTIEGNE